MLYQLSYLGPASPSGRDRPDGVPEDSTGPRRLSIEAAAPDGTSEERLEPLDCHPKGLPVVRVERHSEVEIELGGRRFVSPAKAADHQPVARHDMPEDYLRDAQRGWQVGVERVGSIAECDEELIVVREQVQHR